MNSIDTITILKSLADKTRLDIVRTIVRDRDDKASCSEVSTCSSLSQPAMSHHFGKLVDAGVLTERKVGTEKIYELNSELLSRVGIDPKKL
jgi:ArsR family transcriptional regulator